MAATLTGKIAIVTGAASGIGAECALALARAGAAVAVADVDRAGAERHAATITAAGFQARAVVVDLADEASIQAMIDTTVGAYGGLDILHNNAANTRLSSSRDVDVEHTDPAVWDAILQVNLRGTMLATKHAIPRMRARKGGSIINTSSGAGLNGALAYTAYGVSKAGINALTQYTATQCGKENIRCNAIAPGLIVTPATESTYASSGIGDMMLRHHLTPRLGRPADIAAMVVFLASDAAAFVTGQVICVDGGFNAHAPHVGDAIKPLARD